jgi:hypothetical protein
LMSHAAAEENYEVAALHLDRAAGSLGEASDLYNRHGRLAAYFSEADFQSLFALLHHAIGDATLCLAGLEVGEQVHDYPPCQRARSEWEAAMQVAGDIRSAMLQFEQGTQSDIA